jgi:hypothetical protein
VVAALSALLQLLVHPVLGLADNGDYKRVLTSLHLKAVVPTGQSSSFRYIWLDYQPGGPPKQNGYASTELVIAHAARGISNLLGMGPGMDLRVMGACQSVLLGLAVWLIVRALPGPLALRGLTAALLVLTVTDTRFVVYLDSFFTEPASMLSLLFLVAAVLHAWRRPRLTPLGLLAVAVPAGCLLLSKTQDAPLVAVIALLVVSRRCDWRVLSGRVGGRVLPVFVALVLVVLAGGYLRQQPEGLSRVNTYNAVFVELLGHSPTPEADLRELGLDPELARYKGLAVEVHGNALKDPRFAGFFTKVGHGKIAVFYLHHPGRALALAHRGATASMELKPRGISPPLGNQTAASGAKPYSSSCKLCVYSTISEGWRAASAFLVPALWLAALVLIPALSLRRRSRSRVEAPDLPRGSDDGVAAVLFLLVGTGLLSMAVALLGEGEFEIVKHLFLSSVSDGVLAVFAVHTVGLLLVDRLSRRSAPNPEATTPAGEQDEALVPNAGMAS